MACPGFSISELIKAVKLFNDVRSSFTDRYSNSFALLQRFSQTIELFCQLCEQHNAVLEDRGESFDNPSSFETTLDECRAFIDGYRVLLVDDRKSPAGWIRTALFTFEEKKVTRLQAAIAMQIQMRNLSLNIENMAR